MGNSRVLGGVSLKEFPQIKEDNGDVHHVRD
jgi:hypothetical protein